MTDISTIGQFGLIQRLTKDIKTNHETTQMGIGDDCAIIKSSKDHQILVTTDLMLEGVHFDLTYTPLQHLGYKSVINAISDVLAMNAIPKQILVSVGLSAIYTVEMTEELFAGIKLACKFYNLDLIGGDTTSSMTGLTISVTAIGEAVPEEIVKRSTAKPTDLICVTGNLGAAYMGLRLLAREKNVFEGMNEDKDFVPAFEGKEYIIERQLKPEARIDIIPLLKDKGILPTSMIDVTDGLASDLMQIAHHSNVGIRIYEDRIPIDYQTALMAEEMNMNVVTCALNGGDDHELLFTVPLSLSDQIQNLPDIHLIGHITEASLGNYLVTRDQNEIELKAQGWQGFSNLEQKQSSKSSKSNK